MDKNILFKQYWRTIVWVLVILFLSTLPTANVPRTPLFNIPHFDKLVHFLMYFILTTVVLSDSYKENVQIRNKIIIKIMMLSISYGILMELVQKYMASGRNASLYDAIFNSLGVIFAIVLFVKISRFRKLSSFFLLRKR